MTGTMEIHISHWQYRTVPHHIVLLDRSSAKFPRTSRPVQGLLLLSRQHAVTVHRTHRHRWTWIVRRFWKQAKRQPKETATSSFFQFGGTRHVDSRGAERGAKKAKSRSCDWHP